MKCHWVYQPCLRTAHAQEQLANIRQTPCFVFCLAQEVFLFYFILVWYFLSYCLFVLIFVLFLSFVETETEHEIGWVQRYEGAGINWGGENDQNTLYEFLLIKTGCVAMNKNENFS